MFIKNIIISGFRSYREQFFEESLSPKNNVIVGRNGSGKSNFFAAIQFVLSEKYSVLRSNDRKELFHVGSGRPALSVFVEIVFDNSDGRLVIPGRPESAEVRIRRTVGLKQDEFRVNDRKFSAEDVQQLLESAGFSSSNPYYIVEQGKIVNLANMSEEDRYNLIKDVAGTKVYELRRQESEKILSETNFRRGKISESIEELESRMQELETETAELKEYQDADRQRKAIEYCIFQTELSHTKKELERIDAVLESHLQVSNDIREEELLLDATISSGEVSIETCRKRLNELEAERKSIEVNRRQLIICKETADLEAKEAAGLTSKNLSEKQALEKEAVELSHRIDLSKRTLLEKRAHLFTEQSFTDAAAEQLATSEARLGILQSKHGRKHQFQTAKERDSWIAQEIFKQEELIRSNKLEQTRIERDISTIEESISFDSKTLREVQNRLPSVPSDEKALKQHRAELLAKRDSLNKTRRSLWQAINEQQIFVRRLSEDLQRGKQQMERVTRHDIRQGYQSLQESLDEIGDPLLRSAVHGQLIHLVSVDPGFENAVEVSAGNALFNVVIDTFDQSARLLEHMNRRKKPGRVTFFPLDTCTSVPKRIDSTPTYSPLLSHLKYEEKFKSVFAEIFGKTAVVTHIDVGAATVKEIECDVVTTDGDQFSRKGGITGGYFDKRNLKLAAYLSVKRLTEQTAAEKSKLDKQCHDVSCVEQDITSLLQELEQLSNQENAARRMADATVQETRILEDRVAGLIMQKEQTLRTQATLKKNCGSLVTSMQALMQERSTDFKSDLTALEKEELSNLMSTIEKKRSSTVKLQLQVVQLTTETQLLADTIRHLERRLNAVQDRVLVLTNLLSDDVSHTSSENLLLGEELKLLDSRLEAIDRDLESTAQSHRRHEEAVQTARGKLIARSRLVQEEKNRMDSLHSKRSLLLRCKEEAHEKIRKLGIIPTSAEQFASFSLGRLMHLLKQQNEELKKYAHVNKKAVDQYTALVETRGELREQFSLLEKELESIHELMNHLDQKKGEAIERTFKQIQFQFEEVFRELVDSTGSFAELQLVKRSAADAGADDDAAHMTDADPYLGARVKVCFGLGTAVSDLVQLSGGQKSLVALALIFAIQRCDPAPFYLFDEIDAALDADYRTAVAQMLRKQAQEGCQFVTATFKTEMLKVADRVLGIFFHNKVSRITTITQEEGSRLLRQAMDDRKRARVEEENILEENAVGESHMG